MLISSSDIGLFHDLFCAYFIFIYLILFYFILFYFIYSFILASTWKINKLSADCQ